MTNRLRLLAFLLVFVSLPLGNGQAQDPVELALQINRYYGSPDRALVEGAVEIPYSSLRFDRGVDGLRADANIEVMIQRSDGEEVYRTEHRIEPEAINDEMALSPRVSSIEKFAIYAPPGEYVARARVTDLRTNRTVEVTAPMVIPQEHGFFSDVLLTSYVQRDVQLAEATYLPYLIGTTMFSPNPRGVYFKDAPLVYFYYEMYPAAGVTEITLEREIENAAGETVERLGERKVTVSAEQNLDLGQFSIQDLEPGSYVLKVRCASCSQSATAEQPFEVRDALGQPSFAVTTPQEEPATAGEPLRYYANLTPVQVDSLVSTLSILFTPEQKRMLGELAPDGKARFLNRFWDNNDSDPATPQNEFKDMVDQRIAYADQFFASSQRAGHQTDRGRTWILFGAPTEKIDRPVEATVGAYEIWNYSSLGHTFAFGDFRRDGDYRLIYSTDPRFPGDPTIQSEVDRQTESTRESFLPGARGYERVIEDIRQYRTTTGVRVH
jgi:GWxTD domain-containing protein